MAVPPIKIGVELASLRQPFRKALLTAAQLGAAAVEIDARGEFRPQDATRTAVRQLRKVLDDLNLRVCAVSFRTQRGYEVTADLERRIAATKDAMRFAYDLGAGIVVNHVGRIPPAEDPAWDVLCASLIDLGRFGHHVGALLVSETGPDGPAAVERLLAALPPGALGVCLNPGRLIIQQHSPRETVERLGAQILYAYAQDGVRDLAQGRGIEVPLGRGSADFPDLLGRLEERGYHGYLTVRREHSPDPVAEVGDAIQYLKQLAG